MRKLLFIGVLCAVVASPALADYYGGQVYYTRITGYFSGIGGEFTLSSDGGSGLLLNLVAYSSLTKNQTKPYPSFQTFCLEHGETVGYPMELNVSTTFINQETGVVTGSGSHAVLGGMAYGDNLDPRTAYLYTKFAQGTLTGYDYTAGAGRVASAKDLQEAIWFIEGESGGVTNDFVTLADAAVGVGGEWAGMGIGNVRVLNTYAAGHFGDPAYLTQDQLYLMPLPGAVLLGFLGLGAAGLKLRKHA